MSDEPEVTISLPLRLVDEMKSCLRELSEDLAAALEDRYPAAVRESYPAQQRRYERDMTPVYRALAALDAMGGGG